MAGIHCVLARAYHADAGLSLWTPRRETLSSQLRRHQGHVQVASDSPNRSDEKGPGLADWTPPDWLPGTVSQSVLLWNEVAVSYTHLRAHET